MHDALHRPFLDVRHAALLQMTNDSPFSVEFAVNMSPKVEYDSSSQN